MAKAKGVAKKAPKKASKKPATKSSFAALVRRAMSEKLPSYRFIDTTGGSGPLVTFERARAHAHASAVAPRGLVESVVFQKGLHGGTWFRVNLFPSFDGAVAMGPTQHAL